MADDDLDDGDDDIPSLTTVFGWDLDDAEDEGDLVWAGVCDSKHVGLCRIRYTTTPGLFTPSDAVAQP